MITDYLGNELNIGDEIVFVQRKANGFQKRKIKKIFDGARRPIQFTTNGRTYSRRCIKLNKQE